MPKIYFRCSKCHSKVSPIKQCSNCGFRTIYGCQHNYWWELLYMTIKGIIKGTIETLKYIIKVFRRK